MYNEIKTLEHYINYYLSKGQPIF